MKTIIMIIVAVSITALAQAQPFQKGSSAANLGLGFGTALGGLGNSRPSLSIALDKGVWELDGPGVVSLGGFIGNTGYKYSDQNYTAKWNYIVIGARGAYHYNGFTDLPNLDVYAGAMLAYNIVSYSDDASSTSSLNTYGSGVGLSGFVGGRWFFSETLGAFAELGYGVSVLNLGVSLKW